MKSAQEEYKGKIGTEVSSFDSYPSMVRLPYLNHRIKKVSEAVARILPPAEPPFPGVIVLFSLSTL